MKMGNVEIPEWVNWIAVDFDGRTRGFRNKPHRSPTKLMWHSSDVTCDDMYHNQVFISIAPLPFLSPQDNKPCQVLWDSDKKSFRIKANQMTVYSGELMKLLNPPVRVSEVEFNEYEPETTESNMSRFIRMVDEMTTDQYDLFVDFVNDGMNDRMISMFTDDDKD